MSGSNNSVPITRWRLVLQSAVRMCRALERTFRPGARAWNGAAFGLAAGTFLVVVALVYNGALRPTATWGKVLSTAERFGWAAMAAVGAIAGLWLLLKLPTRFRLALIVVLAFLVPTIGGLGNSPLPMTFYLLVWTLAGAGLGVVASGNLDRLSLPRRVVAILGLVLGLAGITSVFVFLADDGMPALPVENAARSSASPPPPLGLPDPSAPGPYEVGYLTYGSGSDHRHEFGRDADLITESVDGTDLVDNWEGWSGWARTRFWGFDVEALPLQGRVWYPEGDGPFPLVLIVHGNHGMEDYSDAGYAYLGEMLASRGIVTVSVDENFINGSGGDGLSGGLREENDARGWLLLEHLRTWREWAADPGHVLGSRVDLGRIGLIGHSRGGEAVAVAAAFNNLPFYPDDATVAFDYGFDIGAVIAIAPVYGQYRPAGLLTPLKDVNYLVLHGANDADVSSFAGSGQFEAVEYSDDAYGFKSAVYIHGANHGQFNTTWGATDWGPPFSAMLNTEALMSGEDQRQAAKVFISAFLEAALRGEHGYLPLFADPRRAGDWLPEAVILADFRDSRFRTVADFDEDLDVTTATLGTARIETHGLTRWREDRVGMKWGNKATNAAYVGWQIDAEKTEATTPVPGTEIASPADPTPRFTIRFAAGLDISGDRALVLSLADADESAEPKKRGDDENEIEADDHHADDEANGNSRNGSDADNAETGDEEEEDDDTPAPPIDLTVRLVDLDGRIAELPLSRFAPVQAQLPVQTSKAAFDEAPRASEVVYQTFEFPIEWFLETDPNFDLSRLGALELRFDRSEEGVLVVDDVGFAPR